MIRRVGVIPSVLSGGLEYEPKMGTRPKILVVDDELLLRRALGRLISAMGFDVTTASQGQEALDLLAAGSFDLLITDVHMPVMDGLDLIRHARTRWPALPIIVISGGGPKDVIDEPAEVNADAILAKPIRGVDLEAAIRALLP